MESALIETVAELVEAARTHEPIVLPNALNTCVAEARRINELRHAGIQQGHKLVRIADPAVPGRPIDLATATAPELQSAAIGIHLLKD